VALPKNKEQQNYLHPTYVNFTSFRVYLHQMETAALPIWGKVLSVSIAAFGFNLPLGFVRTYTDTKTFSVAWFALIHASVPAIILLRKRMKLPKYAIPINIAAAVVGQYAGGLVGKHERPFIVPIKPSTKSDD
jgi:hypothetical protein